MSAVFCQARYSYHPSILETIQKVWPALHSSSIHCLCSLSLAQLQTFCMCLLSCILWKGQCLCQARWTSCGTLALERTLLRQGTALGASPCQWYDLEWRQALFGPGNSGGCGFVPVEASGGSLPSHAPFAIHPLYIHSLIVNENASYYIYPCFPFSLDLLGLASKRYHLSLCEVHLVKDQLQQKSHFG